jgi:hypothetical protein
VDARLHLVLIELMALALNDIKRSKMFKGIQPHQAFNFQRTLWWFHVVPIPRDLLWLLGISWDHVLKACPWSHQPPHDGASSGFCRTGQSFVSSGKKDIWQWKIHRLHMVFLDLPLAWPAWLRFSRKAKQNHSESPWGKLQFLTPPQKSNTHGRNKTI